MRDFSCLSPFIYLFFFPLHYCVQCVEEFYPLHTSNFIYLLKKTGNFVREAALARVFFHAASKLLPVCWTMREASWDFIPVFVIAPKGEKEDTEQSE